MRALLTTLTLLTIIALSSSPTPQAAALSYPNGPITLVIPLAPGDATDIAGRAMADELAKLLKVAVVPVNRPGAGMVIGTDSVVKAKKDGYTILFANNSAITYWPIFEPKTMPYDPNKDLVPLGLASRTPLALAVRSDAPYRTFKDLVDFAKKIGAVARRNATALARIGTPVSIAHSQPEDATIGRNVKRPADYADPDPPAALLISERAFTKPGGTLLID